MKKIALLLVLTLLLGCTGCSKSGVSQEEYDALKQNYEELQSKNDELVQSASAEPETEEQTEAETSAVIDEEEVDIAENTMPRGGTNQGDAALLPMNTKLRGTVSDLQGVWYSFVTGSDANAVYRIRMVNKSTRSGYALGLTVYDDLGTKVASNKAYCQGIVSTLGIENLLPSTTYYIRLAGTFEAGSGDAGGTYDYMLMIENQSEQSTAYGTSDTLAEAVGADSALTEVNPGTNQDDAAFIPVNVKVSGTVDERIGRWYAFTTGSDECTYQIVTINGNTSSGYALASYIYDELGTEIARNKAGSDGAASPLSVEDFLPNTTYYIRIAGTFNAGSGDADGTYDYSLLIRTATEQQANTATVEPVEEELVFETPFELNSTQVMFVANKAVFIDENAAKEALKPVADVILAHPDHPILLAGTTATDGTQESCVELSNRRAAAVKDLLVSAFGVQESQIQTIGLGYEADPFVRGKDRDANGNFVETEGAKNRRVVVLDIDDPIAQELLNN